jgi:hypothetical protein
VQYVREAQLVDSWVVKRPHPCEEFDRRRSIE